jgi:hypothetical protein
VAVDAAVGDVDLAPAQLGAGVGLEALGRLDVAHLDVGQHDQRGGGDGQRHHGAGGQLDFIFHGRSPGLGAARTAPRRCARAEAQRHGQEVADEDEVAGTISAPPTLRHCR